MRRIESIEDEMKGVVTYELGNGQFVCLGRLDVQEYGAANMLREMGYGHLLPTERAAVIQDGKHVGTVPPDFDPLAIKSKSFFYDPRPGDFRREGDAWVANRTLGPGDLECVPGFVCDRKATEE